MNFRSLKIALLPLLLGPSLAFASPQAPINWAETLRDALTLNNKPKSKDALLQAQKDLTKVARDGMLPTINATYNYSKSPTTGKLGGVSYPSDLATGQASATMSWTIFQCGLNYYTYKSAQVDEKILTDQFNSTQFFIPNTKGGVVASAFKAYETLIRQNDEMKLFPFINDYLDALRPIAAQDPDAKTALDILDQQMQRQLTNLKQNHDSSVFVYNHWVTVDPGPGIYDLQQAIDELIIPPTWQEAYKVAVNKSPDVRQASEQIAKAQYQIKVAQAAFCPQVAATVAYNHSSMSDRFNPIDNGYSNGPTYGVGFTMPLFNHSNRDNLNYQKHMLKADELAQKAALDDAQFSLTQTYRDLTDQTNNQQSTSALVSQIVATIRSTENDIKNKQHLPNPTTSGAVSSYLNTKLSVLGNLAETWTQLAEIKSQIMEDKFSVLQAEGMLFDDDTVADFLTMPENPYNLP